MTFLELFNAVRANVYPEGYSARLSLIQKSWLKDVLIDLQRVVVCMQTKHIHYVTLRSTYFSCGSSVFEAPVGGTIREFWTEAVEDSCSKVHATPKTKNAYECMVEGANRCACSGDADPYEYYLVGDEYYPYPDLPLGLKYVDDSVDSESRACARAFALFDGFIWTYPALSSLERGVLRWEGIKKTWADNDIIPWVDDQGNVDRDVIRACELYLEQKKAEKEECDVEKGAAFAAQLAAHRRNMIIDCKRQGILPAKRDCFTDCCG